jgi:predicted ATPase/DNA-binding CsgD family transcriptional regulator/DNA-binding XRE family transcriptional regulator
LGSFRVQYLSAEVTVKVTAQLLPLNAQRALLALRLIGIFKAKDRAMHDQQTFGSWLRQHRKALDLTQAQLAQQASCSLSAIRQFERDVLRPSRRLAERLAEHLQIPPDLRIAFLGAARTPSTSGDRAVSFAAGSPPSAGFPEQARLLAPATPLLGRAHDLAILHDRLLRPDVRLLTLTGAPGVGKTRLAIQLAADLMYAFPDGVWFVALASISDVDLVLPTIATTLGLREDGAQPLKDILIHSLRDKQLLLVLDNFEQVAAAASTIGTLLERIPLAKIVVTSRVDLHLIGEHEFTVMPLGLPDLQQGESVELLAAAPAVQLFVQRAQAVQPEFALTAQNAHVVAELCIHLDGLPLAIELAAARIKHLPPEALLNWLDQRFDLLVGGAVNAPERHQALHRAIAWSYALLRPPEQQLLRCVGLFVAGGRLEAIAAVTAHTGVAEHEAPHTSAAADRQRASITLFNTLTTLVDHSLLQQTADADGTPRFRMLESIRAFALEQLEGESELAALQQRHAAYYLSLAEEAAAQLQGPAQQAWFDRLEADHDNFRAALRWSQIVQEGEYSLRIALALHDFWKVRGYLREARMWLADACARSQGKRAALVALAQAYVAELAQLQDDYGQAVAWAEASMTLACSVGQKAALATALGPLGWHAYLQNDLLAARARFAERLSLCRALGKPAQIAQTLHDLAYLTMMQGDYAQARAWYEEELVLSRQAGHQHGIFWALHGLGWLAQCQEEPNRAALLYAECLTRAQALGHLDGIAVALNSLGSIAQEQRHYSQAMDYYHQSQLIWQRLGRPAASTAVLRSLGMLALRQGQLSYAAKHLRESLVLAQEMGRNTNIILSLAGLADLAGERGQALLAARLCGMVAALRDAAGFVMGRADQMNYERTIAMARAHLEATTFEAACAAGRAMTLEQAVAEALVAATPEVSEPAPSAKSTRPAGLSRREGEVLALVALGLTNVQIAERLVISPRTVNAHLHAIYYKLGVATRSAATRFAMENGLGGPTV